MSVTDKMLNVLRYDILGDTNGRYSESTYLQLATALVIEGYSPETVISSVVAVRDITVNTVTDRAKFLREYSHKTVVFSGELALVLNKV